MTTYLAAVLAGGLGALARFAVAGAAQRRSGSARPWGTAVVNVVGAGVLGFVVGLVSSGRLPEEALVVAGGGLLGAFTTFSTWMVESVRLREADPRPALAPAANLVGLLLAGLVAAGVGLLLGGL